MIHVACGYANGKSDASGQPVLNVLLWSETYVGDGSNGGTLLTTQKAPRYDQHFGQPVFEVWTDGFISWLAFGPTPDAVNGPRLRLLHGERRTLICNEGDRVSVLAG